MNTGGGIFLVSSAILGKIKQITKAFHGIVTNLY